MQLIAITFFSDWEIFILGMAVFLTGDMSQASEKQKMKITVRETADFT